MTTITVYGTDSNGVTTSSSDVVTFSTGVGADGLPDTTIVQTVGVPSQVTDVLDGSTTVNYDAAGQVLTDTGYSLPTGEVLSGVTLSYTITVDETSYSATNNSGVVENAANNNQLTIKEYVYIGIDNQGTPSNTIVDTTPDVDNFDFGGSLWDQILIFSKKFASLGVGQTLSSSVPATPISTNSTVTAADPSLYGGAGTFDMSYATNVSTQTVGGGGNNAVSYTTITSSQLQITYQYDTPCFMAGAVVRTADGERPIETLAAGDMVLTRLDGVESLQPVRWVGQKRVSRAALRASPMSVAPVRIKAGALGDNSPSQDMLVSPCHGLLIDGLMVQAGALVNGSSVTQEFNAETPFTYYHVELDGHALIVVDNVAAETFLDSVSVMAFDNWRERAEPAVATQSVDELPYPRVTSARQLPRHIRNDLAARAALNGHDFAVQAA